MKVGIIIHSHTGNTLSVAQTLKDKMLKLGYSVSLEQVKAVNEDPAATGNVELQSIPDTSNYDVLIFGAPVRAFSLSPVMKAYLTQLESLKGLKVGVFVTQQLPFAFLGGNRSIKQMKNLCGSKGAGIVETGVINWSHKEREKRIEDMTNKFSEFSSNK